MTYSPLRTASDLPTLPIDLDPDRLPRHLAVIMDGNGRWASQRHMPRTVGHSQGARTLKQLIHCCSDWGIGALTAYAFSTENWRRPLDEVNFLLDLCQRMLTQELQEMHDRGVKFQCLGNLTGLPISLGRVLEQAIDLTQHNSGLVLTLAINYGGRAEIVAACQRLAYQVKTGALGWQEIDENLFDHHLGQMPPPDLLIRTSGEHRLSNFLLWQLAYTELYFTDTLWVDFDRAALHRALLAYQGRQRRFGAVG